MCNTDIHIYDRDLPQSLQLPRSIDNATTHTQVLRPQFQARHMGTDCISNSAIWKNNLMSLLSDLEVHVHSKIEENGVSNWKQ